MKVAIDVSPLHLGNYLSHRVRGTGFYIRNLLDALYKHHPENQYFEYKRGDNLPKDVDIIHYPYFEPFFLTLPLIKRKKTIITVHDLTPLVFRKFFPAGFRGELKWRIQKRSLKNSSAIIADSRSSKEDIVRFVNFPENRVHVVYLAAASYFRKLESDRKQRVIKKFSLPDKFILYVGDVTWNKNLPRLIEAIGKTGYNLIIAGKAFKDMTYDKSNPWNADLKKAQELAAQNNKIVSLGFVENEDLVALYNCATLLAMPSIYEGFGLPILEAMQSGCPVITSEEGSLREVSGSSAYYIDPYDVDSIAQGINKLASDELLRNALSKKGLRQAKKFSWQKTADATTRVYEDV